jgi:regulator of protease activity HflC (stomatin/prohibitin superfamily)
MLNLSLIVLGVVVLAALLLTQAVRITRDYQRFVVFRLGTCLGAKGPGLVLLLPFIDRAILVDLRERFVEIPHQSCITADNVPLAVDFLVYRQVFDPLASVIAVNDFASAALGIAATTLRAVIGEIPLDDVLSKREQINETLRQKLDETTQRWGVKVTTVEIREVVPPGNVQDAMNRQMSAERTRRAVVTEAEGQRQASITVAEGQQQARVLQAEGERQARVLQAEGERQAWMLQAEGEAQALTTVNGAARALDGRTMTLQSLAALKAVGAGQGNTFVIPAELTRLLGTIGATLGVGDGGSATAHLALDPVEVAAVITPAPAANVPAPVPVGAANGVAPSIPGTAGDTPAVPRG